MGETIAIIGAGVIGGAIVRCLRKSKDTYRVIATRRKIEKIRGLEGLGAEITTDNVEAVMKADIVFICVKPGDVMGILTEVKDEISGKLVVSTAAIIPLDFYGKVVPGARFVRTMPNIAAFVGESFTAYCCNGDVSDEDKEVLKRHVDDFEQSEFFVCGPPPMNALVERSLQELGVSRDRIHDERFSLR